MLEQMNDINWDKTVADIVSKDYRAADVFRKHGITYCCGGKFPLKVACELRGVETEMIRNELQMATRVIQVSPTLNFYEWDSGFVLDYIINVHHQYLKNTLPGLQQLLHDFAIEHIRKYPYVEMLDKKFGELCSLLNNTMAKEEKEIFPYVRRVLHAYKHKEPYAGLFIRTLRKPVEEALFKGHALISNLITAIRELTNVYAPPEHACLNHKVVIAKLKELDNDLIQHLHLEEAILFPKFLQMEKDLQEQLTP